MEACSTIRCMKNNLDRSCHEPLTARLVSLGLSRWVFRLAAGSRALLEPGGYAFPHGRFPVLEGINLQRVSAQTVEEGTRYKVPWYGIDPIHISTEVSWARAACQQVRQRGVGRLIPSSTYYCHSSTISTSTRTMPSAAVDRSVGHERIDHKFNFPLFDYDNRENEQRTCH